jgi:hypothetical protein
MAITFVGAGTFAETNNNDNTPTLHASTAENDLIIGVGLIRGLNTDDNAGTINSFGSGYTEIANFTHSTGSPKPRLAVYGKIAGAAEGNPTFDITGLATGNTVISNVYTFRGIDLSDFLDVTGSASENAAAEDIGAISGITALASDGLIVVVGGRTDDFTSVADLTGDSLTWAEAGEVISTLGQDAGFVVGYAIYSGSGPTVTNKTFDVTGGSGKGLGIMFSVNPADGGGDVVLTAEHGTYS